MLFAILDLSCSVVVPSCPEFTRFISLLVSMKIVGLNIADGLAV